MNPNLAGSLNNHAHLFKLVQLLTYFTLQKRKKQPDVQAKDILQTWLDPKGNNHLMGLIESLNSVVMFFVNTFVYEEKHYVELFGLREPKDIKEEILRIINEYWLPF